MSRIGKTPISIPDGITIEINGNTVIAKGPKGELKKEMHPNIKMEIKDSEIHFSRPDDLKENKSLHGLVRSLLANMIEGVAKGFEKQLEIVGVGYRAQASKNKITLNLGFSHPIEYTAPEGIEFVIDKEKKNIISVRGTDKQIVGEAAAKVRSYKKPEPYKGKGIRYSDEVVKIKEGKTAAKAE